MFLYSSRFTVQYDFISNGQYTKRTVAIQKYFMANIYRIQVRDDDIMLEERSWFKTIF